jgi:hypothetical protein
VLGSGRLCWNILTQVSPARLVLESSIGPQVPPTPARSRVLSDRLRAFLTFLAADRADQPFRARGRCLGLLAGHLYGLELDPIGCPEAAKGIVQ